MENYQWKIPNCIQNNSASSSWPIKHVQTTAISSNREIHLDKGHDKVSLHFQSLYFETFKAKEIFEILNFKNRAKRFARESAG